MNEVDTNLANELIPLTGLDWNHGSILAVTLVAAMALFTLVWSIHVKIEDAGIVDFFWGGGFVLIGGLAVLLGGDATVTTLFWRGVGGGWALRPPVHLVARPRHMGGEDARYRAMRVKGGPAFWWRSLFTLYWVQAVIEWLLASPLLVAVLVRDEIVNTPALAAGTLLFAIGFVVEAVADRQLWRFKADPANRGKLMTGGLFAWSRHPNYFGESLLWWGIGLIAFATSGSMLAFVGPLLLTALLVKVSGADLLDAHLAATKPGYSDWAARTARFLPRPPRGRGGSLSRQTTG